MFIYIVKQFVLQDFDWVWHDVKAFRHRHAAQAWAEEQAKQFVPTEFGKESSIFRVFVMRVEE